MATLAYLRRAGPAILVAPALSVISANQVDRQHCGCLSRAPRDRGMPLSILLANCCTNPMTFAGPSDRTARLSTGPSWMRMTTKGGSGTGAAAACANGLIPLCFLAVMMASVSANQARQRRFTPGRSIMEPPIAVAGPPSGLHTTVASAAYGVILLENLDHARRSIFGSRLMRPARALINIARILPFLSP